MKYNIDNIKKGERSEMKRGFAINDKVMAAAQSEEACPHKSKANRAHLRS